MHGRNLIKILKAVDVLSKPQGATIKELQNLLGISRRSVYRLFETLAELQFPIYDDERSGEKEKRWHLEEYYLHHLPNLRLPDMKLTPREQLVLFFLFSQDRVFANTTVGELLSSVRQKLSMLMPADYLSAAQSDRLESIFVSASHHPKDYSESEEILDRLLEAIMERTASTSPNMKTDLSPYRCLPQRTGELSHSEYLHLKESDPRPALAQQLCKDIGSSGTIIAYNDSFEKRIIKDLSFTAPEYRAQLRGMLKRFFDLMKIFRDYYFDPAFGGSNSIKAILPVLVPELSYKELEVQNGGAAQVVWDQLIKEEDQSTRLELSQGLKEYCRLDTLAMVRLYQHLAGRMPKSGTHS